MERVLSDEDFIISKTDTKGKLTYVNKIFMDMADYSEDELLGKPHNIVRHPDMPKAIFKLLWERITNKEEIFAYVVNKSKNGDYYWVFANVTASTDPRGNIIGFYSVRRKPSLQGLTTIKSLYAKMRMAEERGGMDASMKLLNDLLREKGVGYDEYIIDLQK